MGEKKPVAELDPQFAPPDPTPISLPLTLPLRHSTTVKRCNGKAAV
jgi:hypothetical protein